jgi:hypothetical protein
LHYVVEQMLPTDRLRGADPWSYSVPPEPGTTEPGLDGFGSGLVGGSTAPDAAATGSAEPLVI